MEKKKEIKKEKGRREWEFEFCKVCRLNHNQGRGHIYFPNHKRSLSSFLSRFLDKLSDLRFFLNYPSLQRSSPLHRLFCVFCDSFISDDVHTPFSCENSIKHLAGAEHANNVKEFMRKNGGGLDRVDSFRVSDADFKKWENNCKLLKNEASSSNEGCLGQLPGPSKDIHFDLNSVSMERFEKNSNYSFTSSFSSSSVLPLQCYTNESYQVSQQQITEVNGSGAVKYDAVPLHWGAGRNMVASVTNAVKCGGSSSRASMESHNTRICNGRKSSVASLNEWVQRVDSGEDSPRAFQNLTEIKSLPEVPAENVHSGARPPWLETEEEVGIKLGVSDGLSNLVSHSDQLRQSRKLNPKRVGAAWAEKRRIELEREKRGEVVASSCDDNWLPNFGRVWQSGTRKESRKEFEKEKKKSFNADATSEISIEIQPYKSKRLRRDTRVHEDTSIDV